MLRRFLAEAYGCLTRGETFDFAVDTYDLRPEGYARVVRVQFDASVIESGPAARRGVEDAVAVLRLEAEPEAAVEIDTATRPVVTAFWAGASPPVIDGDLSDWVDAAWVKLEPNPHGLDHLDGPEDLDGECAFAVDADHLYLALRVTDDVHAQPFGGWLLWSGDCVQVAVDPLLDSTDAGYGPDDSEFGFTLHHDGRVETWWWYTPKESGGREDIEVAIVREGNQTLYEAAIPAAAIAPWSPLLTRRSGICVAVADADQAALDSAGGDAASRVGRESAIELTDSVVYSKRPDRFAVLELEGPGPDVAAPPVVALGRRRVAAPAGEPLVFTLFGWIPEAQTVRVECELTGDTQSELPASIDVALDAGSNRLRLDVSTAALPRGLHRLTLRALLGGEVADTQQTDVFVW